MRHVFRTRARTRGFSLLEVLIALVVFSLGLLGMTGLQAVSTKLNHSAYLRSQAQFLAQSMADRMRANSRAVWAQSYDDTYPIAGADPCSGGTACDSDDVATRDKVIWGQQLTDLLPNGAATITCTATAGGVAPNPAANPPFNGLCDMQVNWTQSNLVRGANATTETFAWVFQP